MEFWHLALLALVGVLSGFLNVMAGGGSLITVPVLLFMGVPGPVANGTIRIGILAQNITASIAFFRRGFADFKLSLTLSACALPGAIAGAMVGVQLEGEWFNRVIAIIMIGVLVIMALSPDKKPEANPEPRQPTRARLLWGHALMVGVGFYGGFIQLGVGFIIMPVLHRLMGFDLVRTNMYKVFIIGVYTIAALAVYSAQVQILWLAGLAIALGNSVGGWAAAVIQLRRGEAIVKWVLNIVLVCFILKLLFFS